MNIAIYTLGCKVNQYETQAMERELRRRGHTLVPFEEKADAYIVNTCTVTAVSDKKSRGMVRRARKENPAAVVAVCGCYAQTKPEEAAALGVDLVGGSAGRMAFLDELERLTNNKLMSTNTSIQESSHFSARQEPDPAAATGGEEPSPGPDWFTYEKLMSTEKKSAVQNPPIFFKNEKKEGKTAKNDGSATPQIVPKMMVGNIMSTRTFEELPAGGLERRTRAMLKVEDGCVNFCSYCVIPYARGPVRSLPPEAAAAEARRLMDEGYKELVVTGIEISSWGRDLPGKPGLMDLIEGVCAAAPRCRVRLGSLEPRTVTEEFCRRVSGLHNLCPHFHLSLQSGCDETLKRMNRKYDTARYLESVALLRKYYGKPGITTDLIVGFPGETEEEFTKTLDFLRKCAFSAMHIFPYSRRAGTPAAKMPDQVPRAEKEARAARAAEVAGELKGAYLAALVGQELPVLFEEEREGYWHGHAPNYVDVYVEGRELHNVERTVRVTGAWRDGVTGELI